MGSIPTVGTMAKHWAEKRKPEDAPFDVFDDKPEIAWMKGYNAAIEEFNKQFKEIYEKERNAG